MGLVKMVPGLVASSFIQAVATGTADEILGLGPRGESKTISALTAIGEHSKHHELAGYKLPVPWLGVSDTFNSHKQKTIESLKKDFWQGAWRLEDGDHQAIFKTNKDAVKLSLFGIEDKGALDRVRRETCCTWIEEAAPTDEGPGVPEMAMEVSITSQRIPTHAAVVMLTANYPEPTHWLTTRFKYREGAYGLNVHPEDPRRITYQIPKGDNPYITDAMRAKWLERLKHRPDLVARLLDGKPSAIQRGRAVAILYVDGKPAGYNEARHVAPGRLLPIEGEPLLFGQDGAFCPVTTIGQAIGGQIRIYASLVLESGMKQQYEYNVIPWLKKYAPWALGNPDKYVQGCYDPSLPDDESDRTRNPIDEIKEQLGGNWQAGPVDWESRRGVLIAMLNKPVLGSGFEAALQIDPIDGQPLRSALGGGWHYPTDRFGNVSSEKPAKPDHPHEDVGDSFCYFGCLAMPEATRKAQPPLSMHTHFDPRVIQTRPISSNVNFDPRRPQ